MILIPILMIFLVNEYICFFIYGNSIIIECNKIILNTNHYQILMIQILTIISLFCVMYIYKKLLESFEQSIKISLMEQETNLLKQYVAEAQLRYKKTKSFRHDIKNHIEIVKELLQNNKLEEALNYIGEMKNINTDISFTYSTNNPVLDILLSNKLSIAKSNDIDIFCSLFVPYPCQISDIDFCIIISNALDNAICACLKLESKYKRYIHITGNIQYDFLLIDIRNSFQNNSSLKEGIGLKNIRTVVEKYNGAMDIQIQSNEFILSLLLIIPQQK